MRLVAPMLAPILAAALMLPAMGQVAPASLALAEACRLIYPEVGSSKSIIWSGANGVRAVVLGLDGDRLECVFADETAAVPRLAALQVILPSGAVAAYAGKRLADWNKAIATHFGTTPAAP